MTVAVLIADDHPLFRRGLRAAIEEGGRFHVIAEAGDGETAIRQIEHHAPAVAFIDLAMPVKDGLAVAAWNAHAGSATRIVIMTLHKDRDFVDRAVQRGAAGYLVKDDAQDEVLRCLDLVLQGEFFLSPAVGVPNPPPPAIVTDPLALAAIADLTVTQRSVLRHVAEYRSSKEIARLLALSPKTVENHRARAASALGLHGANSLLRFAVNNRHLL